MHGNGFHEVWFAASVPDNDLLTPVTYDDEEEEEEAVYCALDCMIRGISLSLRKRAWLIVSIA